MRCKRCCGLVVVESTAEGEFNELAAEMRGWRCLNCGSMVDIRMLRMKAAHRAELQAPSPAPRKQVGRPRQDCPRIFSSISQRRIRAEES